jgi:hypothetical protein
MDENLIEMKFPNEDETDIFDNSKLGIEQRELSDVPNVY